MSKITTETPLISATTVCMCGLIFVGDQTQCFVTAFKNVELQHFLFALEQRKM